MNCTKDELDEYQKFVMEVAQEAGCFEISGHDVLWHYTDGRGLVGILETGRLRATQVAALNDSQEIIFARSLYRTELLKLRALGSLISREQTFLDFALSYLEDDLAEPDHGKSKFFVSCFSRQPDDLSQWDRYGKENGYAIGFIANFLDGVPLTTICRVIYDPAKQQTAARKLAEATLKFFQKGAESRLDNIADWSENFFAAWNDCIYKLAPLVKDENWSAEDECRIVHFNNDLNAVNFTQKRTMLARYTDLAFPKTDPRLPIRSIMVGPGNDPGLTKANLELLLGKRGYPPGVSIEITKVSLRRP